MSAYEELHAKVDEGTATIIQIVGVPRSMSTALGRSLNETEAASIYVNEPFNRENAETETAAKSILDAFDESIDLSNSAHGLIVVKNMASYMTGKAFQDMEAISTATVWSIRNPYVQIGSLLTRVINDTEVGPGEDSITQEDLGPYLQDAVNFLISSHRSETFSKTGWEAIANHASSDANSRRVSVDGQLLVDSPVSVLKGLCDYIGIGFNAAMCTDWKSSFVNVINKQNEAETSRSAWTKDAVNSTGIVPVKRPQLAVDLLPDILRKHLDSVAMPAYMTLSELCL